MPALNPHPPPPPSHTLALGSDFALDSDPDLRLPHVLANHLNGAYRPLSRPRQRVSFSVPCSPQLTRQQQLVFASGAVGTASALGHVFGRPLQVKETVPCSSQDCTQLQKELQQTMIQQAQSPSHTFQQQCSVHKRFRLFRQRPRKCPVHSQSSGPNYVLPPTTVHPLVVHPDKILLDHNEDPIQTKSWKTTLTSSPSASSHLSSYSSISLSLSTSSFNHGSDGEGYNNNTFQFSKKKKKQSKKEQQQLRCLCYLDASLNQDDTPKQAKVRSQVLPASWYPQKRQKETSRLRKILNESAIFHWSKSHRQQQQPQHDPQQQQDIGVQGYSRSSIEQISRSQAKLNDASQRNSLAGTDFSDEGNHSLSDVEYDEYGAYFANNHLHQVSFQDHYSSKSRSSRPGDDLKAISRHQAELSQLPGPSGHREFRVDDMQPIHENRPLASTFVADNDDDDDEDEDWDVQSIQSDSGAPSSSPMYSVDARGPTSYSTAALPLSPPSKSYLKKPSSANLNSPRRQRCVSLPADSAPQGFRVKSTPSENWDEDFDIDSGDISVPTKVVESQISLQMDIDNIKDFALQIEDLKSLRASLRLASSSLKAKNPKKHQDLSMLFQRDWEQAEVIIDLGEIAQTSTSGNTGPALAAGPLSLLSGKSSPSNISKSGSHNHRQPALSTAGTATLTSSAPATLGFATSEGASPLLSSTERSISQSSSITGTTIAGSSTSGDSETDVASRASSRSSTRLETAVEGLAIAQLEKRRSNLRSGVTPLQPMKESYSSPADLCTTPVTPLPNELLAKETDDSGIYSSSPESDLHLRWDRHNKEDSSATLRAVPMPSNSSSGGGAGGVQAEIDASFRRYQKSSHHSKKRSNNQHVTGDDADDDEEEDDGYESYGYGDGSSIGIITPIPSDRHMQVLKDILMEGLGSDVARQYMFKHGEQDHVRFSVEVIPGLLGHLKSLQQRLGDQLIELQQLTVLV
ncbi:hypothetical protein BGZ79_000662 [Entomortierella chlamydospora]|nr:hypothetical protein BGZ79_000662 [Entomortierella chlamydospora]